MTQNCVGQFYVEHYDDPKEIKYTEFHGRAVV